MSMKAVKPTKVPSLSENSVYSDWKKEVKIWRKTNNKLGVDKTVLAGYESLTGQARSTVLSGLDEETISCDDGVDNIA